MREGSGIRVEGCCFVRSRFEGLGSAWFSSEALRFKVAGFRMFLGGFLFIVQCGGSGFEGRFGEGPGI